ncbi:MAG: 3-isopropylmalate dehydratase small subunit [Deltaproteobacteria bacterium]|nr:3-isopropylmalate dehydratase small subunit [Deltaproteobacteria bacterium]
MRFKGRVWKFGADVDTDVIIPARYLVTTDPKQLAAHCMEPIRPEFAREVKPGDIIVAEKNFGSGSSREHAPIAIKAAGVTCIIARSFARIFYRNSFNMGLPLLECAEAAEAIADGDEVEVDAASGAITDRTTGKAYRARPIPEFMQNLINAGGLMAYVTAKGKAS